MSICGAIFFGMIIGIILGVAFPDEWMELLEWTIAIIIVIIGLIPCCIYGAIRYIIHPVPIEKWEKYKSDFKYKQLSKNCFICIEADASKIWNKIFFVRLKISS